VPLTESESRRFTAIEKQFREAERSSRIRAASVGAGLVAALLLVVGVMLQIPLLCVIGWLLIVSWIVLRCIDGW
jgi:Flp pilus assembly protein TadB